MEKVRLGDVFFLIRNGANIKQGLDNSGYPITRIETISDRSINREKMGYAGITDISKYEDYILQEGDILMSHINSEKHLGKTAIYKKQNNEFIIHGMNLLCLRPDNSKILSEYAFYFLSSNAFFRQIPNITKKSVNQASFTVTSLKELLFINYTFEEQKRIVAELDKITDLIDKRKKQLEKLDELVKSRFVELFGGCNKRTNIKNSGLTISDGNYSSKYPRSEEFVEGGVPFIRANNLKNGTVIDEDMYFITAEKHQILLKGHLKPNDVLITTRGNIGQIAIVPEKHNDSNINAQIVLLRDESGRFLPQYLLWALQTEKVKNQYVELQTGTALKQLPVGRLEQVVIIEPPIALQKQFSEFVEQTDKSKLEIQKSLEELELLKKALMQKYFG